MEFNACKSAGSGGQCVMINVTACTGNRLRRASTTGGGEHATG